MRAALTDLDVIAMAARLPATDETAQVSAGSPGRRLDLPAFGTDPRLDPDLPPHLRHRIDRFSALAYLAVSAALAAVPEPARPAPDRIGLFIANTKAGWSYGEPELGLLVREGLPAMHAYQATAWFPAAAQGEVTIALGLHGCAKTTTGRESGFAEALWLARDALERDAIDLAVVGAAESLVNGFVLRDWPADGPLPSSGPAEGAVMFALRRSTGTGSSRLRNLCHAGRDLAGPALPDPCWVPTLSIASRLFTALRHTAHVAVPLGGGYQVDVDRSHPEGEPMSTVRSEITTVGDLANVARHELVIPGPVAEVFEMTRDVGRWADYMPAVTSAEFVEQTPDGDLVQITAEANNQRHTWRSRRSIDRTAWTIDFSRVGPVAPLVRMSGRWEFSARGGTTRAVLTHRYATTTTDALCFFDDATRSNATRDLQGLAEYFSRTEDPR
ncbi:MAG TPA: SRPBCC family protein [Mycobacteriales bacterium]|nr:SRPBCC family protein [Mycobacteriales bacterium]